MTPDPPGSYLSKIIDNSKTHGKKVFSSEIASAPPPPQIFVAETSRLIFLFKNVAHYLTYIYIYTVGAKSMSPVDIELFGIIYNITIPLCITTQIFFLWELSNLNK